MVQAGQGIQELMNRVAIKPDLVQWARERAGLPVDALAQSVSETASLGAGRGAADVEAARGVRECDARSDRLPLPAGAPARSVFRSRTFGRWQASSCAAEPRVARHHLRHAAAPGVAAGDAPRRRGGAVGARGQCAAERFPRGRRARDATDDRLRRGVGGRGADLAGGGLDAAAGHRGARGHGRDQRRRREQHPSEARRAGVPGIYPLRYACAADLRERCRRQVGPDVHPGTRACSRLAGS